MIGSRSPGAMMPVPDVSNPRHRRDWPAYALAASVGALGLMMMHHPMIFSGLRRVQVDLGDSRLINYLLEHNYLWYLGAPGHEGFWDPPFFYPARNIAAYSDSMLGIAPLYAAFRVAGFVPDTAFQLWMLALSALNYAVMLHFLTRRVGLSVAGASAGAFLFAFGSPRLNMLAQQTQMTQFLSLVSVDALFGLFVGGMTSRPARAAAWVVAAAGMMAQLSSAYYPGWFMVLALGIVSLLAIWMSSTRRPFLSTLLRDAPWIALAAALSGLVMRQWLAHHLAASRELGTRSWQWIWPAIPRPASWLDTGTQNWIGGWAARFAGLPPSRSAPLGIGMATTAAVLAGLYLGRRRASIRLLATGAVVLALCLTVMPSGLVSAAKVLLLLGPLAFAYVGRRDHPRTFLLLVGLVLMLLNAQGFAGKLLLGCGLFTLMIAAAAFVGRAADRREGLMLGALILGLSWTLFGSPIILGYGAACGGLLGLAAAVVGRRSIPRIEATVLGGFLAFVVPVTYAGRPAVWLVALGAPLAVLAARRTPVRPPSRSLLHIALVGLAIELLFNYSGGGSAWGFFFLHVPGASSMIFVYRVGLILLIPAAIGLGYAIDALLSSGRTALALGLGLVCLIEQGGTTAAFDKFANREAIASLSRRIDVRAEAFYYTPEDAPPSVGPNLDAMWAGLARGRPTINGYSGHTPRGWRRLDEPDVFEPADLRSLAIALERWKATYGRSVAGVQWIGGPEDRPARFLGGGLEIDAEPRPFPPSTRDESLTERPLDVQHERDGDVGAGRGRGRTRWSSSGRIFT